MGSTFEECIERATDYIYANQLSTQINVGDILCLGSIVNSSIG